MGSARRCRDQNFHRLPEKLVARITEQGFGRAVHQHDVTARVHFHDCIRRGFEQRPKALRLVRQFARPIQFFYESGSLRVAESRRRNRRQHEECSAANHCGSKPWSDPNADPDCIAGLVLPILEDVTSADVLQISCPIEIEFLVLCFGKRRQSLAQYLTFLLSEKFRGGAIPEADSAFAVRCDNRHWTFC